jgi:tetratricopeptide (TPR) repeat protein
MRKPLLLILTAAVALASAGYAEAGWDEGVAAFRAGKLDTAAQEFRAVVDKTPEFAGGHFMLGQVLLKQNKDQEALGPLRKAYELDSGNVSYQMALGQAYLANRRYKDAQQILTKVNPASLSKDKQTAYYEMLGAAASGSGDADGALRAFKRQTENSPRDADAWYRYGSAAFNGGDTDTAVSALEKAVALDGSDLKKKEAYAKALVRKARLTQGSAKRPAYQRAVSVASDLAASNGSYENLLFLGETQLGAADYPGAVSTLKKAAAKNGAAWYPYYYLSQAYTLLSQYNAAESSAQAALDNVKTPEDRKRIWDQIGFAHEKQKNFDQAIEAYMKAGNQSGVNRVQENKRIASENKEIEAENEEIKQMEAERKRLEDELRDLGGPPHRR